MNTRILSHTAVVVAALMAFSFHPAAAQRFVPVGNFKAEGPDELSSISRYLGRGEVDKLAAWFSNSIEIVILGESNTCSRSQAKQILKSFYNTYTPRAFKITHKAAQGNVKYAVGNLSAGGSVFTVTIFLCLKDDCFDIHQLKFEKN
ncbi:MAG: DUF4783 domain-containing protein [Candidatus Cryptobacteroides sp.]